MIKMHNYSVKILSCALIFSVILFGSPICATETIIEASVYPHKPQDVVKAFIEAGLKSTIITKEMRLCDEVLNAQYKYFPDEMDRKIDIKTRVLSGPWGHCLNKYHIVTGYEIKEGRVFGNKAAIKVTYNRLGWIWFTPTHLKKCKDRHEIITGTTINTLAPTSIEKMEKDDCKFVRITKDTSTVIYHLAKPGRFWRIIDCCEPHVSVESAIKILECEITEIKGISKQYPSEEQKAVIRTSIEEFKKYGQIREEELADE